MVWLVLSCACPKSRTVQWGGIQGFGREHGQESWPELAKGIFPTREHHVRYTNWGELAVRGSSLLKDSLSIHQWVVSRCTVHHLSLLHFISLLLSFLLLSLSLVFLLYWSFCFLGEGGFLFGWFSSRSQQREGGRKQMALWYLIAGQG